MPPILDSVSGVLGAEVVGQIGRQLATDPASTRGVLDDLQSAISSGGSVDPLAGLLRTEHQRIARTNAPLASMLRQALDADHGGSMTDEKVRIAAALPGGTN